MVIESKYPVKWYGVIGALLNYFVGYLWLYPAVILRMFHLKSWNAGLEIVLSLYMIVSTALFLKPVLTEGYENFRKLGKRIAGLLLKNEIMIYGLMIVTGLLIQTVFGLQQSANQDGVEVLMEYSPFMMIFLAAVMAPVVEELLFRGIFFRMTRPHGRIPAMLISALLFGLMHCMESLLAGNWADLAFVLEYGAMGLVFCDVYEKTDSIWPCMLLHMLHNCVGLLFLAFA
ncbi:MAG: CPBP family intramembrane metalloprotease [Erysipelotrichaceae bacterium]|nr:CPBP family intramembrane metalloprotease [Erysipelotrichaceae bacterium]